MGCFICGICNLQWWYVGSSSLTMYGTCAPYTGSLESEPLDHQGSPSHCLFLCFGDSFQQFLSLFTLSIYIYMCVCIHTHTHTHTQISQKTAVVNLEQIIPNI